MISGCKVSVAIVLFAAIAFLSQDLQAQEVIVGQQWVPTEFYSLDVQNDGFIAASGESYMAKEGEPEAAALNPATLASVNRYSASYTHRSFWLRGPDAGYSGVRVTAPFRFGTFSFSYRQRSLNIDQPVTTEEFPDGTGEIAHYQNNDNTYALTFASNVTPWMATGLSLGTFNTHEEMRTSSFGSYAIDGDKKPILFDVGFVFHTGGLEQTQAGGSDRFSAGISLQNFGSELTTRMTPEPVLYGQSSGGQYYTVGYIPATVPLPRFARIGFEYARTVRGADPESLQPVAYAVTLAYANGLNLSARQDGLRNRYSAGCEITFYEMISLQAGYLRPGEVDSGSKSNPIRWGGGLSIPCQRLGISVPIYVLIRYADIPSTLNMDQDTRVNFFSLRLEFDPNK